METIQELKANKLKATAKILNLEAEMALGLKKSRLLVESRLAFLRSEQILNRHRSCYEQ